MVTADWLVGEWGADRALTLRELRVESGGAEEGTGPAPSQASSRCSLFLS